MYVSFLESIEARKLWTASLSRQNDFGLMPYLLGESALTTGKQSGFGGRGPHSNDSLLC